VKVLILFLFLPVAAPAQNRDFLQEAQVAFRAGDHDLASVLARKVLQTNQSSVNARMILGLVAAARNQWVEAKAELEKVTSLAPNDPNAHFYLGQIHLYMKQWPQAIKYFNAAAERGYRDPSRLSIELALAQNESGAPQQAISTLKEGGVPSGPYEPQYYAVRALIEANLHQPEAALESIQRARDLEPLNPQHWEFLISILIETNQYNFALPNALEAQKKFPDSVMIQYLFGFAGYLFGESQFIRLAHRNVVEAEPGSPLATMLSGLLHYNEGRKEQALVDFRDAAQHGIPSSQLLLGLVLKESGDLTGAERQFRAAEKLNPRAGQVQFEIAKLLLDRGEAAEGLSRLIKAEQYMPSEPIVQYRLGMVFRSLGDSKRSSEHLENFRRLKEKADQESKALPILAGGRESKYMEKAVN
jgi:tetratricopeptide (TPR) repeat protein